MPSGKTPEQPTIEPEIIPPGSPLPRPDRIWTNPASAGFDAGSSRLYIVRPGPLTTILWVAFLCAVMLGAVLLALGTVVILLPAVGIFLAVLVLLGLLRRRK